MANIVITGANRGIGLALAKLYEARGDSVTAVCRETNDEIEEIADPLGMVRNPGTPPFGHCRDAS